MMITEGGKRADSLRPTRCCSAEGGGLRGGLKAPKIRFLGGVPISFLNLRHSGSSEWLSAP